MSVMKLNVGRKQWDSSCKKLSPEGTTNNSPALQSVRENYFSLLLVEHAGQNQPRAGRRCVARAHVVTGALARTAERNSAPKHLNNPSNGRLIEGQTSLESAGAKRDNSPALHCVRESLFSAMPVEYASEESAPEGSRDNSPPLQRGVKWKRNEVPEDACGSPAHSSALGKVEQRRIRARL